MPNFYSGVYLQNITIDQNLGDRFSIPQASVERYNAVRRVLYLNDEGFALAHPSDRGVPVMSVYTVVFLAEPLEAALPAGSTVHWAQYPPTLLHRVAVSAPPGSTSIAFQGSRDPCSPDSAPYSLLNLGSGGPVVADFVCSPPWADKSAYNHWKKVSASGNTGVSTVDDGNQKPVSLASFVGSYTIAVRGKKPLSLDKSIVPYMPYIGDPNPLTMSFMIRSAGVFEVNIENPGSGYTVTERGRPLMALLSEPKKYLPPFEGMGPPPEVFGSKSPVYTFLNICFVDVVAVDGTGGLLAVRVNTPGSGYRQGALLTIVDGEGGRFPQKIPANSDDYDPVRGFWGRKVLSSVTGKRIGTKGLGRGGLVRVMATFQSIGVFGGSASQSVTGLPEPGDSVFIPTYGKGLPSRERSVYNTAPSFGEFTIQYSGADPPDGKGYIVRASEFPRTIADCDPSTRMPETGWRVIDNSVRSLNSQCLISENARKNQYAAPGCYLSGRWLYPPNRDLQGDNEVLWLGIQEGFDLGSFTGEYACSLGDYVSNKYAWSDPVKQDKGAVKLPKPGEFVDHRLRPPLLLPISCLATGNSLEILTFTRDSDVPINYTGSTVSQNQATCYEVQLLSVSLPNLPLDTTIGGLIAFYPFVYVELSNVTAPSASGPGQLYSNNPNATRALFRCAITQISAPEIAAFVKITGNGAVQTIKFKPNDNLRFRVFFSDGKTFQNEIKDNVPPLEPNPFVQVSAQFSIRRIV